MGFFLPHSARIGMRFGLLKIDGFAGRYVDGHPVYRCLCGCGDVVEVPYNKLSCRSSCGCAKVVNTLDNIVGKSFGFLTVRRILSGESLSESVVEVECGRCGGTKVIPWRVLTSGRVVSCGCLAGAIFTDAPNLSAHRAAKGQPPLPSCKGKPIVRKKKAAPAVLNVFDEDTPLNEATLDLVENPRDYAYVRDKVGAHDVPNVMSIGLGPTIYRLWCVWSHLRYSQSMIPGVEVCPAWKDFKKFKDWSLYQGFVAGAKLVRRDPSKPFHPSNCYWEKV